MSFQLVVKNTFICAMGEEEEEEVVSAARMARRRHRTLHAGTFRALSCSSDDGACSSGDETAATTTVPSSASSSSSSGGEDAAPAAILGDFAGVPVRELAMRADGAEALALAAARATQGVLLALLDGLRGSVHEVARSVHGSEFLQQLLHYAGTRDVAFIAEELLPESATVALNNNSCSVLCRLVEYSPEDAATAALIDGVLVTVGPATLIGHKYGHHLVVSLLSNGLPYQRRCVLEALVGDVHRFARHRFGSHVIEQALLQSPAEDVERLSLAVIGKAGTVVALACHHSGMHVVKTMLEGPCGQQVLGYLQKAGPRVAKDRYGAELLRQLAPGLLEQVGAQ